MVFPPMSMTLTKGCPTSFNILMRVPETDLLYFIKLYVCMTFSFLEKISKDVTIPVDYVIFPKLVILI
jgi:hypothetical protein